MAAFRESVDTDRRIKKRASKIGAVAPSFGATRRAFGRSIR